jgi:hypothetical protein
VDPGPRHWDVWQFAIRRVFLYPNTAHLRLRQPLRFWLQHSDSFWTWWTHPTQNELYCRAADQSWSRRRFHTQRGNRLIFGGGGCSCPFRSSTPWLPSCISLVGHWISLCFSSQHCHNPRGSHTRPGYSSGSCPPVSLEFQMGHSHSQDNG